MRFAWGLVLLAGCTAIFDLSAARNVDRDNDGVEDAVDNCPDAANRDQSDFDKDGIGDACDTCDAGGSEDVDHDGIPDGCDGCIGSGLDLNGDGIDDKCACVGVDVDHDGIDDCMDTCIADPSIDLDRDGLGDNCDPCTLGPQHDEDGDGIFDACDNCPTVPNADQLNVGEPGDTVQDNVGDACDQGPPAFDVQTYDVFDRLQPVATWYQQGSGWMQGVDSYTVSAFNTTSYRMLGTATSLFQVSTIVRSYQGGTGSSVGVFAADQQLQPGGQVAVCAFARGASLQGDRLIVDVNGTLTSVTANPTPPFRLTLLADLPNKVFACRLDSAVDKIQTPMVTASAPPPMWFPGIVVTRAQVELDSYTLLAR